MIRRRSSCCLVLSFRVLGRELRRSWVIDGGEVVTAIVRVVRLRNWGFLGFSDFHGKWKFSWENVEENESV